MNGNKHGKGKLIKSDGSTYEGNWNNNEANSLIKYTSLNGL
jgi:hypothetical protein